MPDGTILEKGTQLHTMNMTCECADMEDSWEEPVAHCIYTLWIIVKQTDGITTLSLSTLLQMQQRCE